MIAKTISKQTPLKKVMLVCLAILFSFGVALLLAGCGNNADEQRIAELEAEVERLQSEQGTTDDDGKDQDVAATEEADDQKKAAKSETSYDDATIQDFSDRADDLIARVDKADVPNDRDTRIDAFFDLDSEFNALELEMDTYEDQQEGEYRSGSLSWDDYRALELQLEQIEDKLDTAQDKLEARFGVDD